MTLDDYQTAARKTAIYPGHGTLLGLYYAALALAGEAGEVAGKVSKVIRDDPEKRLTDKRREQLADEGGDVLWTLAALATELGVPLSSLATRNLSKLASRAARGTIRGAGDTR